MFFWEFLTDFLTVSGFFFCLFFFYSQVQMEWCSVMNYLP
ncbi:hypothetical protein CWATWH0005_2559 [Crocosphaera watsonii WH 0005]|uniref:Uncharacterized protein n=1 Tax=Crocosphaera watsonii WH 0005 TaxID=423472 RepID=T2IV13_CROWT|nr:hypothetical protein CWATWH0005_2559 [Crocosphaera watsonii WH 0005]